MDSRTAHPAYVEAHRAYNDAYTAVEKFDRESKRRVPENAPQIEAQQKRILAEQIQIIETAIRRIISAGAEIHELSDAEMPATERNEILGAFIPGRLQNMKNWLKAIQPDSEMCE